MDFRYGGFVWPDDRDGDRVVGLVVACKGPAADVGQEADAVVLRVGLVRRRKQGLDFLLRRSWDWLRQDPDGSRFFFLVAQSVGFEDAVDYRTYGFVFPPAFD